MDKRVSPLPGHADCGNNCQSRCSSDYILLAILKRVFTAREVTITEIYRAMNVYIMIALTFGMVYTWSSTSLYRAHSSSSTGNIPCRRLSTSVSASSPWEGSGDVIATGPLVHSVITIEMIVGVMYMAIFIGLLVNAHYSTRYSPRNTGNRPGSRDGYIRCTTNPHAAIPAIRGTADPHRNRCHAEPRNIHHHGRFSVSPLPRYVGNLAGCHDRRVLRSVPVPVSSIT